jgi:hypothetical protein
MASMASTWRRGILSPTALLVVVTRNELLWCRTHDASMYILYKSRALVTGHRDRYTKQAKWQNDWQIEKTLQELNALTAV